MTAVCIVEGRNKPAGNDIADGLLSDSAADTGIWWIAPSVQDGVVGRLNEAFQACSDDVIVTTRDVVDNGGSPKPVTNK